MSRIALVVTVALATASFTLAQNVQRFDMGPVTGPLLSGWTAVSHATAYSAALGHGWSAGVGQSFEQPAVLPGIPVVAETDLIRDGVDSYVDLTFRVDVQNGRHHVVCWLGNLGNTIRPGAREDLDVTANGTPVVVDMNVRTLTMKAQFINAIGGYRRVPFLVTVANGRIDLLFQCNGSGISRNSILGVEVYPDVPAPIAFDHGSGGLVADPAHATALAPALAAFNAADYAGARAAFDALTDARLRAWGYAWLLGWLTGDEDEIDDALIAVTIAQLRGLGAPDDISVAGLLYELEAMRLGDFYNRARGYTPAVLPGSFGSLLINLNAAVMLFEQMRGDVLSPTPIAHLYPSPLHVKAHFLQARNMHSRNTLVNDPINNPYTAGWLAMLVDIWNRLALFPKSDEAAVMGFLGSAYGIPGGLVQNWAGPTSLPPITPANAWWAPFVVMAADPNAPRWANFMRHYYMTFRNCGEWWMTRRLIGGEIGGGDGDDVEGAGLLGLASVAVREPGHVLENGAAEVMDKVLYGPSMTPSEGYFTSCGDVEHSAEFSSNPLFILLFANYGHPRYIEYALRTVRNLDGGFDPVPWTAPSGATGRQFLGYRMGANSICGPQLDIPINMRAAVPGFAVGDYAAHPGVLQVFDELARGWAAHAMSTAQGKPQGVFPGAVSSQPPYVFGTGGNWWENAGYIDLAGGPWYHSYVYALLLSAYAHSSAPDRHVFLQPLLAGGLFLYGYRTGTVTGTAPGTGGWTANLLKQVIADAVARARGLMIADPNLGMTATQLTQIDTAITAYASAFEKHVALPVIGTKPKLAFENVFGDAATFVSHFFPLSTSAVSYTDRIFIMTGGSQGSLYGAMTGASTWGILPPSVVSWSNPDPAGGELDFAALVNDIQANGLDVLLYNYSPVPRDFGLRIWRTLPAGQYEARIGDDQDHDDVMDGAPHTIVPFSLSNPGVTVVLPNLPTGVLQKIELRQLSPSGGAPAALSDPALSAEDVTFGLGGNVAVTVHNLGSAALVGATVELLQNGVVVGSGAVPVIQPPLDYQAKTANVSVCCASFTPGATLTVRLVLPPATAQVTTENDAVVLEVPGFVTIGAGCPGAAGVPALQLTSLPVLGGTYGLDVTNLAGGFAAMAIGFDTQTVPLAPFGLGFGPTCVAHVTTDAVLFLVQAGGAASWSLPIPPEPGLNGLDLFNQVVELGAMSAVSNGVQAQIH